MNYKDDVLSILQNLNAQPQSVRVFIADNLPIVVELFRLCHYSGIAEAYPLEERYDTADLGYIETECSFEQGLVYKTDEDVDNYEESFTRSRLEEYIESIGSSLTDLFNFFTVLTEQKNALSEVRTTLSNESAVFEDHYGTVTPAEYVELEKSLTELNEQRTELETDVEKLRSEKTALETELSQIEKNLNELTKLRSTQSLRSFAELSNYVELEKSDQIEKLKEQKHEIENKLTKLKESLDAIEELEYKIKAVETQMDSFNLNEGEFESDLYAVVNEFIETYLDPTDFEVPVGWRLDSIYENITIQQKLIEKFTQNFEKAFGNVYLVKEALHLDSHDCNRLLSLVETNEQSLWKLKELTTNHLESNYDFESLMKYLKKVEKKNIFNI